MNHDAQAPKSTPSIHAETHGNESPAFAAGRDIHASGSTKKEAVAPPVARSVILFVAANPHDGSRLRGDEEAREIGETLEAGKHGERFRLETIWAARTATLEKALLDHKPSILHFSGHGLRGAILLEENRNRSCKVPIAGLGELLGEFQDTLRCVVLSCCESLAQAETLAQHVDCVIGTPGKLSDDIAVRFAASFYQALAAPHEQSIQTAFDLARASLKVQGYRLSEQQLPQIFTRRRLAADLTL